MKSQKNLKKIFCIIISFILLFFLIILSCPTPNTSSNGGGGSGSSSSSKITITSVGWVIENIDESFWNSSPGTTCFYDWFVEYSGDNISLSDIQTARIYLINESWYWDLIPDPYYFDGTNKRIGGWARWYWGAHNHILPIGNFRAEVVLTNGHRTTYDITFPAPGSTTTNGFNYVYSEQDIASPGAEYTPMIKRATILPGYTIDDVAKEITIEFNVDDTLVYSGYVSFHDSSGNWVGSTKEYFRDFETGVLNADLLATLNTDGTDNTVSISNDEIYYDTGKNFDNIAGFILVLTDGAQYAGQSITYDCLSRSVKTNF